MKKDGETLGYVVLECAGWRYPDLGNDNWVISPYWIKYEYRKRGYGTILLVALRNRLSEYLQGDIFALVQDTNIGSIHAMEKAGFRLVSNAKIEGKFRKYKHIKEPGEYRVYKLIKTGK